MIVDYAHTDDALENLIRTARELNPKGRIITLFGCGGGKDRTKRPVMGEVTGRLSDLTILSNDNPRSEDPLKIISDIVVGLQKTTGKYLIEPDREKAIGVAWTKRARETSCCSPEKAMRIIRFSPTDTCLGTIAEWRGERCANEDLMRPGTGTAKAGRGVWHLARNWLEQVRALGFRLLTERAQK